jgi:aminoglycoside phosphotransferase (APT) family kinase protein
MAVLPFHVPDEEVGSRLLALLRSHTGEPSLTDARPPARMGAGFDTRIFAFELAAAPPGLGGSLVLRLERPAHAAGRVHRQVAVHEALHSAGHPVPRVVAWGADPAVLGAGFLVMERLPGRPLLEARPVGMGAVLAAVQSRLHGVDAAPLRRALARMVGASSGGGAPGDLTVGWYLAELRRRVERGLDGLGPALAWLEAHRPAVGSVGAAGAEVICHGDLHPGNILVEGGRVTGVLDWPNTLLGPPELDVASTLTLLRLASLRGAPVAVRILARAARPILVRRYLSAYRGLRPLRPERLPYYEPWPACGRWCGPPRSPGSRPARRNRRRRRCRWRPWRAGSRRSRGSSPRHDSCGTEARAVPGHHDPVLRDAVRGLRRRE